MTARDTSERLLPETMARPDERCLRQRAPASARLALWLALALACGCANFPPIPGRLGGGMGDPRRENQEEERKQGELQQQIKGELQRQQELLQQLGDLNSGKRESADRDAARARADKTRAPPEPALRSVPDSLFKLEQRTVGGSPKRFKVLDVDRNGFPEIEIELARGSEQPERRSEDTNYDDKIDAVTSYKKGVIVSYAEDSDFDGRLDRFTTYENGLGVRVELDRNNDGRLDGFLNYAGDSLASEEFDDNFDGRVDRRVQYAGGLATVALEDRDGDGRSELRTYFDESERPSRIEKDTNGDDKPDIWEFYEGPDPTRMQLVRREEDTNRDGVVDAVGYYEKGKLSRREILSK